MVAMQLNSGPFIYEDKITGTVITQDKFALVNYGLPINQPVEIRTRPYLVGYFREYWRDPTFCTFGSNTAIPAITGVVPSQFTDIPGNFNFYVDLQITRLLGGNSFDFAKFYNAFNQAMSWVITSNSFLVGLKNAQDTNLKYYGFNSYDDLVTQGFNNYKSSNALKQAFNNLGFLVQYIPEGSFGTPNMVAKAMIDFGLGSINNLSEQLYTSGIVYGDIYNPNYTSRISEILLGITNQADLLTMQEVLNTSVPAITSPMSYASIEGASGRSNDSGFKTLSDVGKDIYLRAPGSNFTTGSEVSLLIENIQNQYSPKLDELATQDSLLTPEIIATLRSVLPRTSSNEPVSILNIIGTASGYLQPYMKKVNDGLAELYASPYGPQIRQVLTDISRYAGRIPLNEAEKKAADAFTPVPPPTYSTVNTENGYETFIVTAGGPDYYLSKFNGAVAQYTAILSAAQADGATAAIVRQINENYNQACQLLQYEVINFNKANMNTQPFYDSSLMFNFITSLPSYAADTQNLGTDYLLFGLAQNNDNGKLLQTILGQAKNEVLLSNAGAKITGVV